ncbi:hypothetical protein DY000_02009771 [Brassica cretica]|uniref:EXS domain-containing protein n=1 Tax=Brassica cretica TaxID=69181 RepID=A0ABQ7CI21_BRACR|nr:hypothetical protein DY000_02009771 [Brassica cretica]
MGAWSTIRFLSPVLLPCLAAVRLDLRICQLGFSLIRRFIPSLMCVVTSSIEVGEAASGKSMLSLVYECNVIKKSLIFWRLCGLEAMVVYWWLFRILWSDPLTMDIRFPRKIKLVSRVMGNLPARPTVVMLIVVTSISSLVHLYSISRATRGTKQANIRLEASVGRSYAVSWFLTDGFFRFLASQGVRYVFSWLHVLKLVLRWRWLVVPGLERVLELLSHLK